jgi:cytochrome c oxidase subunit 3
MSEENLNISIKPSEKVRAMHPQKFAMWLFIITVVMIFISLTSAYVVKKGAGDWQYFVMPDTFQFTTLVILLSSVSMHFAYLSARKNHITNIRVGVVITAFLAVGFIIGQVQAWSELVDQGAYFVGNPAGSFIYVFTGLHVAHLVGGVIFLLIVLISAFRYQVHSKRLARIEMCTTYWHFLGGLWMYLYIFLLINN